MSVRIAISAFVDSMLNPARLAALGLVCWICLAACAQPGPDAVVPTFSADAALTQVVQTAIMEPATVHAQPAVSPIRGSPTIATKDGGMVGDGTSEPSRDPAGEETTASDDGIGQSVAERKASPPVVTEIPVGSAADATSDATAPAPTATLGPKVTRTPGVPGMCPEPSEQRPTIEPIGPNEDIANGFLDRIIAFLNAGGSVDGLREQLNALALEDESGVVWTSKAQAMLVDVTGNATPDAVVSLVFLVEGQFAEGALYVFSCRDGAYSGGVAAPLFGQALSAGGPDPGIRAIQDMNSNGVNDIALSYIEIVGTHSNFTRLFRVLEWDGESFVSLVEGETGRANAAPVLNGDGAIFDTNGNRNLELVLTNQPGRGYPDGGPQRVKTDVWAWTGYAFKPFKSDYEPPSYRFQAVQDGDDALTHGRLDSAMAFYEQVIADDSLLGWQPGQMWTDAVPTAALATAESSAERIRLSAYALFRIMQVHILQGAPDAAEETFMLLRDEYLEGGPGEQYANLAQAFWQGLPGDLRLETGCQAARQYAKENAADILVPLGSTVYGYLNRDYEPLDICPFTD